MNRGEVWWVKFDPAVGSEVQKTRPAVIISNEASNRHLNRVVVAPLTSNVERVYAGQALVHVDGRQGKVMCDQIMTADKSRLAGRLGVLSRLEMKGVERALKVHLGLPL